MKYRLVKETNTLNNDVEFIIEKKRRIFGGWSRNYLWSDYGTYHSFSSEKEAKKYLDRLNGITPWYKTEIVK